MSEKEKMMPDEAGRKGGDIVSHLIKIYDLIEWGDEESEFVRVEMHKNKTMNITNHKDVRNGLYPTVFQLKDGEWGVEEDEVKEG